LLAASGLPQLEARALLAHELQSRREVLIAHPEREVEAATAQRFERLAARRRDGEPLAYLLGEREFYGRTFAVTPSVLIPRPETELLVRLAIERAAHVPSPRILDLGTGSGCIAITLALENSAATIFATDIERSALEISRTNAQRLGASVRFAQSDWYAAVEGFFDVIVANPPYVAPGDMHLHTLRHEPQPALVAADHGLACLRRVIAGAPTRLTQGGWLLVEHGYDQAIAVRKLFSEQGLAEVQTHQDDAKLDRVTTGRRAQ
jgi:release factor glutamine methyltransferase